MYHYAYLLTFQDGMKYVGARSSSIKPSLDSTYLGSGRYLPEDRHENRNKVSKIILGIFNTREELTDFETDFIKSNDCVNSTEWYNKRYSAYDKHGKGHTGRGFTKAEHRKGMDTVKRRNYTKGANRTPAQLAKDIQHSKGQTGISNPAKGHKGTTNCAFIPWYYIDPQGNYVEVHKETKRDKAKELGFTERQLIHAFHKSNEHKEAKTLPRKGWTFGNLPMPK